MFEKFDGRRKPGYTIASPTDKKYKWTYSKFTTSIDCKGIFYIFRQNWKRKM